MSEKVRFKVEGKEKQELIIVFQSFGFKYGLPSDADYVFDVRFLPNPHWEPALRPLTGLDAPIHSFLEKHSEVLELKPAVGSSRIRSSGSKTKIDAMVTRFFWP